MKDLTYSEAIKYLETVRWKTEPCHQKDCWCLLIVPEEKVFYRDKPSDNLDEVYIAGSGSISADLAKLIVEDHNRIINQNQIIEKQIKENGSINSNREDSERTWNS